MLLLPIAKAIDTFDMVPGSRDEKVMEMMTVSLSLSVTCRESFLVGGVEYRRSRDMGLVVCAYGMPQKPGTGLRPKLVNGFLKSSRVVGAR